MLLVSSRLTGNTKSFRAPKGMLYKVESINFTNITTIAGAYLIVLARKIQGEDIGTSLEDENILASTTLAVAGNDNVRGIDELTKFISIAKTDATVSDARIEIYGSLVKASKIDIIIEWLRRGR